MRELSEEYIKQTFKSFQLKLNTMNLCIINVEIFQYKHCSVSKPDATRNHFVEWFRLRSKWHSWHRKSYFFHQRCSKKEKWKKKEFFIRNFDIIISVLGTNLNIKIHGMHAKNAWSYPIAMLKGQYANEILTFVFHL